MFASLYHVMAALRKDLLDALTADFQPNFIMPLSR